MKFILALLWTALTVNLAMAADSGNDYVAVSFISDVESVKPGDPFTIAIKFTIADDWHIYWRNPGDSGIPTMVELNSPEKFNVSEWKWPVPKSIPFDDMLNFGYEKEVLLIAYVYPGRTLPTGKQFTFTANVSWLVCKEKCLPGKDLLSLTIKTSDETIADEKNKELIEKYKALLPLDHASWSFQAERRDSVIAISGNMVMNHTHEVEKVHFIPISTGIFKYGGEQKFSRNRKGITIEVPLDTFISGDMESISGVLISDIPWDSANPSKALIIKNIKVK